MKCFVNIVGINGMYMDQTKKEYDKSHMMCSEKNKTVKRNHLLILNLEDDLDSITTINF